MAKFDLPEIDVQSIIMLDAVNTSSREEELPIG